MAEKNLQAGIIEKMDQLDEAIAEQRAADDKVRSLKAEVAGLNVKLASSESSLSIADFSRLVGTYINAW